MSNDRVFHGLSENHSRENSPWGGGGGVIGGSKSNCSVNVLSFQPYANNGVLEPESNRRFDGSLRAQ